jgi:hypothetical protein
MESNMSNFLRSFDGEAFQKAKNQLWMMQDWQWPIYLKETTKFNLDLFVERGAVSDCSFLLQEEDRSIMAFLGFTAKDANVFDVPCITIQNIELLTANASKAFLTEFDEIVNRTNGVVWYRDFLAGGKLSILSRHLLLKGAKASSMFSQVIDLSNDVEGIRANIRRSYKALINWGMRELDPVTYDAKNITWEIMNSFRMLHIQEAGKETRSEESWQNQFKMIRAGEAFVVASCVDGKLLTAGLFMHSRANCYYAISASRRDMFDKPLFHSLMWTAILHAKKIGCRWFEVGGQVFSNHPHDELPSKKQIGISGFKAGFGGDLRAFLDLKLDRDLR